MRRQGEQQRSFAAPGRPGRLRSRVFPLALLIPTLALLPLACTGTVPRAGGSAPAPGPYGAGVSPSTGDAARPDRRPVPVLMYHLVEEKAGRLASLYVRPEDFRAQVAFLRQAGYQAVTLADVARAWGLDGAPVRPLPPKPVVLTFDDGYESVYTQAFPVLRAVGWPATLFLIVDRLDTPGYLTDGMVREMVAAGFEVASHTLSHADLRTLGPARLRRELADSRARLQERFGVPVLTLSYPAGAFDDAVAAAARRAGYLLAVTTRPGLARPDAPYALDRVRVSRGDTVAALRARLTALDPAHAAGGTRGYAPPAR